MAVVSLEALSKRYGPRLAVDGVSFEVEDGEVMGLLGPNGSGKSTILRVLTGYLRPTAGRVRVGGLDVVRDGRAARRLIGYVPEDVPLYSHMRVDEFLAFMGRLRGLRGAALQRAVDAAADRLALAEVRDTIVGRLSRGYRQRVSLAQAVLHEPRLLVLDEPTNGLDPRQIIELRGLLRMLAENCAVLVTSHILAEIERVADRVAILLDGRLLGLHRLQRRGARDVTLRAAPAQEAPVRDVLARLPGDAGAPHRTGPAGTVEWRLRLHDAAAVAALADALARAGIASVEIAGAPSSLETLFLELTAREGAA